MRVVTTLPQEDLRRVPEAARAAEAEGYGGLITMENRNSPFLAHVAAALATDRIQLGTAIAIAFARSPMVVANMSWDLQIASSGRFSLGIGPQVKTHNERRFSVPWTPPVPRLREYVEALRAIWTTWEKGTPLKYEGEHYKFTLMTPAFVPPSQGFAMVPVTLAAVGEHSLRLAGEVGDGVQLHPFCSRLYIEKEVMPRLAEGFAKSGRVRENFEINGGGFLVSGPNDAAIAKTFEWVRERVAFYGSTPSYWPVLEVHGLGDLGRKLNAMSREGKWKEMSKEITDDMVHLFAVVAPHDRIAGAIRERFSGLTDSISASPNSAVPSDLPREVIADIQSIVTPFKGFKTAW
jgi:probable F420-dependent oxidoreductase